MVEGVCTYGGRHPRQRNKMELRHLLAFAAVVLALASSAAAAKDRKAFVTIHYEGTDADAEYILGVRVLLRSLQPLQHPFIILVSKSVSQSSRDIFTREGATLIEVCIPSLFF
jgi:hypothetical protein